MLALGLITAANAASISTHPSSQNIVQGQPITLSVSATGSGSITYQWEKDGQDITGATSQVFSLIAVKPWNVGSYRVRVTDADGTVSSNAASLSLNTTQPSGLWNGLLLFLPFSGSSQDISTSARTITQNNVGAASGPSGTVAGAMAFDGTSSLIDFSPNLPDLTDMTLSVWIKTMRTTGSGIIFLDWDDADSNDLGISLEGKQLALGTTKNGSTLNWSSPDIFEPGVWNHVIWVMGATQSKVYLNGVLYQTINGTASNVGYKLRSNVGYSAYGGGQQFFLGSMSSLRIYGRALSDAEAVYLYQMDASLPEIVVEQPSGTILESGTANTSWTALPTGGTAAPVTYTIRNIGTADLTNLAVTKTGVQSGDFIIGEIGSTTVASGSTTSFTVTFAPNAGASGNRAATLHISSNDLDENPFDISLTGLAYSTTLDADADGMSDWGEYKLAALGFDWQIANVAQVAALYANASAAGLYTVSQVQDLNVGTPILQRNESTSEFRLTVGVEKSANLNTWTPFPMTTPQTLINSQGKMEFRFTVPDNAAFFRLRAE